MRQKGEFFAARLRAGSSGQMLDMATMIFRSVPYCNVCGSNHFVAGPNGRKASTGALPECSRCHSLERHRAIRATLKSLPAHMLAEMRALHFSPDGMLDPLGFQSYEPSIFRGKNHIDLNQIDRPDGAYDFVALSHVLEYMDNDRAIVGELSRVISDDGALLICFARPLLDAGTIEFETPQPPAGNYRTFGRDIFERFRGLKISRISKIGAKDDVTGVDVEFFLFFRSARRAADFQSALANGEVAVAPAE
jgi:hypothetical protein